MRVLLLHPEDGIPVSESGSDWDLVVDFGRAPVTTYEEWRRRAGCRVISLYDFAEEIDDLYRIKALLQLGMGQMVDRFGIDWWDVSSLLLVDDLLQIVLLNRLAKELGPGCELHTTRTNPLARILQSLCNGTLHNREATLQPVSRRVKHYAEAFAKLDAAQVMQVLQDKYDPEHAIRRRFAIRRRQPAGPVTLLPTCYINVSRMAVAYAAMLPDERFLLVYARRSGKLKALPPNVTMASLDPCFTPSDPAEVVSLLQRWEKLRAQLAAGAPEFAAAESSGALGRIPQLVRSGVATRNAWNRVFEKEEISGCLCTDDTAPYTRIPLILAKNRRLPTLACHHGALDLRTASKKLHADIYLAKGEMERDYLLEVGRVRPEMIVTGGPASSMDASEPATSLTAESWLVFFSEPYQTDAWRSDEIYRDLLPQLCAVAKACGLRLVFKIHPFESIKSVRRLLRTHLSPEEESKILVLAGRISPQLWQNAKVALTGQSTVVLDCCSRGIPVFLCAWLRSPFGGYIKQYAKFGIGYALSSSAEISEIPRLIATHNPQGSAASARWLTIDSGKLGRLLHGEQALPVKAGSNPY